MLAKVILLIAVSLPAFETVTPGVRGGIIQEPFQPRPYSFGYNRPNDDGSTINHRELSDGINKQGSYGYTSPDGLYRQVNYVADAAGYRATVSTNEPGTANQNPANVAVNSGPTSQRPTVRFPLIRPSGVPGVPQIPGVPLVRPVPSLIPGAIPPRPPLFRPGSGVGQLPGGPAGTVGAPFASIGAVGGPPGLGPVSPVAVPLGPVGPSGPPFVPGGPVGASVGPVGPPGPQFIPGGPVGAAVGPVGPSGTPFSPGGPVGTPGIPFLQSGPARGSPVPGGPGFSETISAGPVSEGIDYAEPGNDEPLYVEPVPRPPLSVDAGPFTESFFPGQDIGPGPGGDYMY